MKEEDSREKDNIWVAYHAHVHCLCNACSCFQFETPTSLASIRLERGSHQWDTGRVDDLLLYSGKLHKNSSGVASIVAFLEAVRIRYSGVKRWSLIMRAALKFQSS